MALGYLLGVSEPDCLVETHSDAVSVRVVMAGAVEQVELFRTNRARLRNLVGEAIGLLVSSIALAAMPQSARDARCRRPSSRGADSKPRARFPSPVIATGLPVGSTRPVRTEEERVNLGWAAER